MKRSVLRLVRWINERLVDVSYATNSSVVVGGPLVLMIEPSAACNLRCPLCPTGRGNTGRSSGTLTFETFKQALRGIKWTVKYINFWNYGEPFLNRELAKMVHYAARWSIQTQVSTNGHFLRRSALDEVLAAGLSRLIVSVDTPNPELYGRYRVGGDYDSVIEGFQHAVERRTALGARTRIVALYIMMSQSECLDEIIAHGCRIGADEIVVKTLFIGSAVEVPSEQEWALMPSDPRYWRYVSRSDMRARVLWGQRRCEFIWRGMVLGADGTTLPCCRDQTGTFKLGSLQKRRSLLGIWNSKEYRKFRRGIRGTQTSATMCQRCGDPVKEAIDPGLVYVRHVA